MPTQKYWNKLKSGEKIRAINNIQPYFDSLNDKKYCKKARTYLSDKNFNDEFKKPDIKLQTTDPRLINDIDAWRPIK